jgi:hypothetical protein
MFFDMWISIVQVGLLLEIGKGLVPPSIVKTILLTEDRRELAKISQVAPAHGLYLMSVAYDDKLLEPLPNTPKASFGRWLRYPVHTSSWKRWRPLSDVFSHVRLVPGPEVKVGQYLAYSVDKFLDF